MSRSDRGRVVIAGGGTAGHVLPGLAVARALVASGVPAAGIVFVGSARGLEAELVPAAGFEVVLLPGRGVQRRWTRDNIGAIWGLIRAFVTMIGWVRRERPRAVLSLGGYASVAASLAAVLWRVPIVVTEQNAAAGSANRLIGRFARSCSVPVPGTDLPHAVVTGNPVRAEVLAVAEHRDRDAACVALGIDPRRRVIAAFAGSLGARRINEAVMGMVGAWSERSDLAVHHVLGARDWDALERPEPPAGGIAYRGVRYEDHMELVLAAADVAVCRAGGTTVAELAVGGGPSVLVPLPIAPRDHQRANAAALVDAGAAVLVTDGDMSTERLVAVLGDLLDHDRLPDMARAAASLGRPDAASAVAELVLEAAR